MISKLTLIIQTRLNQTHIKHVLFTNQVQIIMKKSLIPIALSAIMLLSTDAYAKRHNSADRNLPRNERVQSKNNSGDRHQGASALHPSKNNKDNKKHAGNNGSNNNNNSYSRPGRQPQTHPDKRPVVPIRPITPVRPVRPVKPAPVVRPVRPVTPVRPVRPAYRPGRPVYSHWVRPVRPVSWRPSKVIPVIRPLFGLNFGMGLNVSVNLLNNSGYSVYEYGDKTVYLNNVTELNLLWPEGILFYENGGLNRTQLYYSTPFYDSTRYDQVYAILTSQYGTPVSASLPGGGIQSTWFGNNGGYIQLDLSSRITNSGSTGFFTTLTYGD